MRDVVRILFEVLVFAGIPLAAFATGLRVKDPFWLWKRPRLLGRSLLAVLVVVPVVATLLVELLRPSVLARAGIIVAILSVGMGAPNMLKRSAAPGTRSAYEVGLDVVLLSLAILYIPAAIALHGAFFHHQVRIDPAQVARVVLFQMLVPLALGIAFARIWPRLVDQVGRLAGRVVHIALAIIVVFALLVTWRRLFEIGAGAWLTCAVVAASAIAIGHLFGMGQREIRPALVAFSVLRFPGLAVVIVAAVGERGRVLMPVVLAYVLTSAVLLAVYGSVSTARARKRPEAPLEPAAPAGHRT